MTEARNAPNGIHVELFVPDFKRIKEFYGKLGFTVVWEIGENDT